MRKSKTTAVIWDFDGTLVDTSQKNFNVARKIIAKVTGQQAESFSILCSLERYSAANRKYQNWRDLYRAEYSLSEDQTDEAGGLWTTYQLQDNTPVSLHEGIEHVVSRLKQYPQGIVSMNSRNLIEQTLNTAGLLKFFDFVVGYEEVHIRTQKPEPDGLLLCLENLTGFSSGTVFYIGDHETDIQCAANANARLRERNLNLNVISIAARYSSNDGEQSWEAIADYSVNHPKEILDIIRDSRSQ